MKGIKIFTAVISCVLLATMVSGCGGTSSPALSRTIVSETLVSQIDSPWAISPLIYSPDARRVAYIADRDGKKYVVVDEVSDMGYDSIEIDFRMFSPDSKRVAYAAVMYGEKPPAGNRWFVVIDGEEGHAYGRAGDIAFSPDSKHVAYVADGRVFLDRVQMEGPEGMPKSGPLFSPDSQHLAYVIERSGGGQSVVLDGVPGKPYGRIGAIVFSPDSKHLAYRAMTGRVSWVMVVDGKEVGQYESSEWNYQDIVFSPDSRHLAYVAGDKDVSSGHEQFVVLDGKELTRYKNSLSWGIVFSPDNNRLAYGNTNFVMVDSAGMDSSSLSMDSFVFSPDSKRYAYKNIKTGWWGQTTATWAVVDGVKCKEYDGVRDITFSPDSKHVAYVASQGKKQFVVVDEKRGAEYEPFGRDFGVSVSTLGLKRLVWDTADRFHYLVQKDNGIYLVKEAITE